MFVPRTLTSIARSGATHILETYTAASLLSTLTTLGLTANLKLCLDAGEGDSYTSGQSWLDLSGGGYDFFRGADGSATATDPTFNGVADALSSAEFFSVDGGDYFRYDSANETWMNALHTDSAKFTIMAWVYPAATGNHWIFGTSANDVSKIGFAFRVAMSTTNMAYSVSNGSGTYGKAISSSGLTVAASTWQMVALSADEAANYFFQLNTQTTTPASGTVTSPSASNATHTAEICAAGGGLGIAPNGARIAMVAVWDTNLTAWQLEQIYNKTRRRFGV